MAVALCFRLGENFAHPCYGIVTAVFAVDDLCMIKAVLISLLSSIAAAQEATVAPAAGVLGKGAETLYGPLISAGVEVRDGEGKDQPLALRGVLFRPLGGGAKAWGCYDIDRRALVALWPEAELDFRKSNLGTYKGTGSGAVVVTSPAPSLVPPPDAQPSDWLGIRIAGPRVIFCVRNNGAESRVSYELKSGAVAETGDAQPRANWPERILTQGAPGREQSAFVADRIPLPDDNPWKCWLRPSGLVFLPDGRLALCTLSGDVWIADGLDDTLFAVVWTRFAGGLREPLGLRVVDGKIVVGCRDQIVRLHDTNDDGEADYYECVNAGRQLVPNFHAFAYDLQTDSEGRFYFGTGGNQLGENEPWHGQLWRVEKDGGSLKPLARGLRAPNGLTIGPDDAIYVADNQGQWIPSSSISRIREGGFYGFVADPKAAPKAKPPAALDAPMLYLPMTWDNSSGGGEFCPPGRFGPFAGKMIHTSFGAAALFAIFEQRVGEVSQAAAVKFPLKPFDSGIMRARFSSKDGALYVCGLKGWQSKAVRDGCLARIRYTGKPVSFPTGWKVSKDTMIVTFDTALNRSSAGDPQNYSLEQWNYQWHGKYGSPDFSLRDPKRLGRDSTEISAVQLSEDAKTLTLSAPGLRPSMQFLLRANLKSSTGEELPVEVAGTIHVVP